MPTTCVVVGCYNRHCKGSLISFYRFPTDSERRHRWICFVSRQNPDGTPWKPVEGDRLCSEHFISKKKSDLPNNPDYVPSVYPETIAKKSGANVSSLARFERAQRRSATNEIERLTNEKDEERKRLFVQQAIKAFKNDHGAYCKTITEQPCAVVEQIVICQPGRLSSSGVEQQLLCIPAEVGKVITSGVTI